MSRQIKMTMFGGFAAAVTLALVMTGAAPKAQTPHVMASLNDAKWDRRPRSSLPGRKSPC